MTFANLLDHIGPAYEIPQDNLIGEVLIPAMSTCQEVRIAVGFFTSRCLAQIAPGLAAFLSDTDSRLQLIVSPEISKEDRDAIERGLSDPKYVLQQAMEHLFVGARLSESAVERHAVDALAYLVASNRLDMRVALMQQGMFHKKLWLFRSGTAWLCVHGSSNATERGLLVNGEQMSIDRAWMDGERAQERVNMFLTQWDRQWSNDSASSLVVRVDQALHFLKAYAVGTPPTVSDFWTAWRHDYERGKELSLPPGYASLPGLHRLAVPLGTVWREGTFAHQGRAVDELLQHGGGILSIATGGGKTKTALLAISELQSNVNQHLCVVVLAPTRPLIRQWGVEVQEFQVQPVILSGKGPDKQKAELEQLSVAFSTSQPRTEVIILSHALFGQSNSLLRSWLTTLPNNVCKLLIADEVHNLGVSSFIDNPPDIFDYRIGLSATPIRQYDPDGTDQLFEFFGGAPVFEFSLEQAIRVGCLVPYNYYLHQVHLTAGEMEYYSELTEQLLKAGFRIDDNGQTIGLTSKVARLLQARRAVVEQAGGKMDALERELKQLGPSTIGKTLIYTSAKATVPGATKQIIETNLLLQRLNIVSHQYTSEESQSHRSQSILDRFDSGTYQVLTSMKVLDEGINIPQVDTAFLLASSTVEREWVQRRGRILRTAPGKSIAHLHDFIVVPPDLESPQSKSLLRSELRRATAFATIAANEYHPSGPNRVIRAIENQLSGGTDG